MHIDHSEYTILLADDSVSNMEKMKSLLAGENFRLVTTLEAEEVFLLAKLRSPDLIIVRLALEEGKGIKVVRQLKESVLTKHIPILYMTMPNRHEDFRKVADYEDVEFVSRPLSKKELVLRINNQLLLLESQRIIACQNEKIQDVVRSKDKLYSVIAHDLRAPIGTLKMILEAIDHQKERIPDSNIKHLIKMLQETTDEAYLLLENLLMWSNSQNGVLEPSLQTFSFSEAAKEVVALQENIAGAKGIKMHNHLKKVFSVHADLNMMKTVLRNLLSNAIKFSYKGGEITINGEEKDGFLIVSVQDKGQGISKEHQRDLFADGLHFISYGTQKEKGSGLGLQLCKDFVKMNHGKIWFNSEEGKGTTFYFSIPVSDKVQN
ncbi:MULTISPECIES: hybrid sensor histidine kinase/response regulator [Butyricimonas]|uniref:hybrid sensor histidine kinase/response regulator n=1 Tax=Butyricimonas TaxID=574697 RepID=UPI0007FB430D|nr:MULTISPECIES: hybrid sensor histidine kinase/response regulator [Butyricimonas]